MLRIEGHRKNRNRSDAELLEKFVVTHDPEIMGELYGRYLFLVYGVCLKYFNDRERSKDAVISLFEKIMEESVHHQIRNFKSWLYVVTKNHCLMEIRKTQKGKIIYLPVENEMERFMENEPGLHPVDREPEERNEKALLECMEKLNNDQKECIRLFYYQNRCYREIAEILKTEEKKVKSYIQNGKRNLKICLESKNEKK